MKIFTILILVSSSLFGQNLCGTCNLDSNAEHMFTNSSKIGQSSSNSKDNITIEELPERGGHKAFSVITEHYELYLEGDKLNPKDTGKLLEAAWKVKNEFFQASPPEKEKLKIEVYADKNGYFEALNRDKLGRIDSGGYYWEGNKKAYLWWQSAGVDFTRYLLLHEATHQFEHLCGKKARVATFWVEGLADYLGMHHWNGKSIKLGATMNSHILKDRAATALKTYSPLKNDFSSILERDGYSYEESWALVHFLMNRNKEMGRRLFNNMTSAQSLKAAWQKTYKTEVLDEKFHKDFIEWLTRMKECPEDIFFVSWGDMWFGWERAGKLQKLLRKKSPESLLELISEMEILAEKSTGPDKLKETYRQKAIEVMLDVLKTCPKYRYEDALNALSLENGQEELKKECFKSALKLHKAKMQTDTWILFNALAKLEMKEAEKMILIYEQYLTDEKQKAIEYLKEKKFYEAYRIYNDLCKIFPKSKDLGIYKLKEKLETSENSSRDLASAEKYLELFRKFKNNKYSRKVLLNECRNYEKEYSDSRFKEKVNKMIELLEQAKS